MTQRLPHPTQRGIAAVLVVPVALTRAIRNHLPAIDKHINDSKFVGQLVVDEGLRRASAKLRTNEPPASSEPPATAESAPAVDTTGPDVQPQIPHEPSAVADYSSLAASQVVALLNGLTRSELAEVRAYEEATRHRRTILAAVTRLAP